MCIILDLIEERNNQLLNFDSKKEQRDNLVKELESLDKEIQAFNKVKILSEIDELTECAIKLGLIDSQPMCETEESTLAEVMANQGI
jgi:hypothetical protein